eukprot:1762831-Amphidinium_carterae.3
MSASTDSSQLPSQACRGLCPLGAVPTFVNFVSKQCDLHSWFGSSCSSGLHAADGRQHSSMPPVSCTGSNVKAKRDLSIGLKVITLNVRTLHDSGKMKFVAEQLHAIKADIVFIQESRLPAHADMQKLDGFELFSTPAISGHGGLLVLVRQDPLFSAQSFKICSSRVMTVRLFVDSILLRLLCAHAPIAEAPMSDHEAFAECVSDALADVAPGEVVLAGCDLNARLASLHGEFDCVGPHACSSCPTNAVFRHSCLKAFDAAKLVAANTVIESDSGTTWRHPSGSEQQIDFVMIPHHLLASGVSSTATPSDHRHVAVSLVLTSTVSRGKGKKLHARVKVVSDQHLADFQADLSQSLANWDGTTPARLYLQQAMATVASSLKATTPRLAQPRKPWITAATWQLMRDLNKWRRLVTARRRGDMGQCNALFQALGEPALGVSCNCQGHCACGAGDRFTDAVVAKVAEYKCRTRAALRMDRRRWFDEAFARAAEHERGRASRELHQVVKALSKGPEHRGARLRNQVGEVVTERSSVDQMWLEHWKGHFAACLGDAGNFADRTRFTPSARVRELLVAGVPAGFVFSADEVTKTIRSMPRWRATADAAPAAQLGPPMAALFNECVREAAVPCSYGGARLVPVWKKKGSSHECASYRPVALLLLEAKVFARLCLQRLLPLLTFHCSQFGSGSACGVIFPQIIAQQVAAFAKEEKCSSATLFVDVVQAFDAVPLPLLWGTSQEGEAAAAADLCEKGYSEDCAARLISHLQHLVDPKHLK